MYSGVLFVKGRRLCSCFIVVAILRCESCRLGTAQDRRNGGQTVESDQEKIFVVVSLAITHLTGKDGLC